MSKNYYKKEKKESLFQKLINVSLTILLACAISSQVCTAANNNLRIAHVSDVHLSTFEENTSYKFLKKSQELLYDVVFQINTSGPYDFVMFTGDLVNKPKVKELESFVYQAKHIMCPWYVVNGNHDIAIDGPLDKEKFIQVIKETNPHMKCKKSYYAFTPKRGYRVICLDSIITNRLTSNGEIPQEQLKWLRQELTGHTKDVIVLCTHVPINEPYNSPNHRMINENEVKEILQSFTNPIIVLQGHYHCTRVRQDKNIVYISTPSLVTFPNAFRVININSNKDRTLIDIFLKETNLKQVQARSKMRLFGVDSLYGQESDRNVTIEIKKNKG